MLVRTFSEWVSEPKLAVLPTQHFALIIIIINLSILNDNWYSRIHLLHLGLYRVTWFLSQRVFRILVRYGIGDSAKLFTTLAFIDRLSHHLLI